MLDLSPPFSHKNIALKGKSDDYYKRIKDQGLRACTVSYLGLVKLKADITNFQEVRWTAQVRKHVGYRDSYYSRHIKECIFAVRFVAGKRLCHDDDTPQSTSK